jgi:precorrin-2/cobalt-factor-2 C20-methyltransferase
MAYQALASRTETVIAEDRGRVAICTALGPEDLACDLADTTTTVVVYKGGRHLPELAAQAAAAGRETAAVAGELIGMPGERIGALRELAAGGPASYLATVIVPAARGNGRVGRSRKTEREPELETDPEAEPETETTTETGA